MTILIGPRCIVGRRQGSLASHPVVFGIDQRAVHVPQNGGGELFSEHNDSILPWLVCSSVLSINKALKTRKP
jgi:hypothetical protein